MEHIKTTLHKKKLFHIMNETRPKKALIVLYKQTKAPAYAQCH